MSQTQTPPPPMPQGQQKKKFGALAWVLIGCLGLLLIGALVTFTCTAFVAKKAKNFVDEAAENPAMATAEMLVRVNPELEMVSKNEGDQTITVRNKKTGEEVTVDFEDIAEGRFSFESDGKQVQIDASQAGEGGEGVIRVTDEDGDETMTIGSGSSDQLPAWLPEYPGAEASAPFLMSSEEGVQGTMSLETGDSVDEVAAFFTRELEASGFSVEESTFSSGDLSTVMLSATAEGNRTAYVSVSREGDGPTRVGVNFSEQR